MKRKLAKIQPVDGDTVIHCGHLDADIHHFFQADTRFRRPDGSQGRAKFLVGCDDCFRKAGGKAKNLLIRGDGTWKGNEPIVFAP